MKVVKMYNLSFTRCRIIHEKFQEGLTRETKRNAISLLKLARSAYEQSKQNAWARQCFISSVEQIISDKSSKTLEACFQPREPFSYFMAKIFKANPTTWGNGNQYVVDRYLKIIDFINRENNKYDQNCNFNELYQQLTKILPYNKSSTSFEAQRGNELLQLVKRFVNLIDQFKQNGEIGRLREAQFLLTKICLTKKIDLDTIQEIVYLLTLIALNTKSSEGIKVALEIIDLYYFEFAASNFETIYDGFIAKDMQYMHFYNEDIYENYLEIQKKLLQNPECTKKESLFLVDCRKIDKSIETLLIIHLKLLRSEPRPTEAATQKMLKETENIINLFIKNTDLRPKDSDLVELAFQIYITPAASNTRLLNLKAALELLLRYGFPPIRDYHPLYYDSYFDEATKIKHFQKLFTALNQLNDPIELMEGSNLLITLLDKLKTEKIVSQDSISMGLMRSFIYKAISSQSYAELAIRLLSSTSIEEFDVSRIMPLLEANNLHICNLAATETELYAAMPYSKPILKDSHQNIYKFNEELICYLVKNKEFLLNSHTNLLQGAIKKLLLPQQFIECIITLIRNFHETVISFEATKSLFEAILTTIKSYVNGDSNIKQITFIIYAGKISQLFSAEPFLPSIQHNKLTNLVVSTAINLNENCERYYIEFTYILLYPKSKSNMGNIYLNGEMKQKLLLSLFARWNKDNLENNWYFIFKELTKNKEWLIKTNKQLFIQTIESLLTNYLISNNLSYYKDKLSEFLLSLNNFEDNTHNLGSETIEYFQRALENCKKYQSIYAYENDLTEFH